MAVNIATQDLDGYCYHTCVKHKLLPLNIVTQLIPFPNHFYYLPNCKGLHPLYMHCAYILLTLQIVLDVLNL